MPVAWAIRPRTDATAWLPLVEREQGELCHVPLGGPPPAHLRSGMAAPPYPRPMPTTHRPGSTTALRKLRAFVLARDGYLCQRCPTPHQLTTHDKSLPTHATLGHRDGSEWAETRATSLDPDDYRAECARSNYSHGAKYGNQRRGLNTSRSW